MTVRLGTRGSLLARTQASTVAAALEAATGIDDKLFAAVHLAIVSGVTGFDRATIRCESRGVTEALPDEDAIVASSTYTVTGATTS